MAERTEKPRTAPLPTALIGDRKMPADLSLERMVLSAMLREPVPCIDVAISQMGNSPELFYSHIHREIFSTMVALHEESDKKVDAVTVAHTLLTAGRLEDVGGEVALAEIFGAAATTVNLDSWCVALRELYTLRRMIAICGESLMLCYDPSADAKHLIEKVEGDIFQIRNSESKQSIFELRHCITEEFKYLQDLVNGEIEVGIGTGFSDLDGYTGGLKPGEMFVLAARPSIGKTSLALNIIRNIVLAKEAKARKVLFFSLEMTHSQIVRRLICTEAKVSEQMFWNKTFHPNDIAKLTPVLDCLRKAKLYIDPTGGLTISELRAKARRMRMTPDDDGTPSIDLIVIDYLQLMSVDRRSDNRQNDVAEISGGIKALAKELNIPILVLAQLNREVDKTAGASARPKLSHLRESGSIEQDADVVAFLHRNRDDTKDIKATDQSVEAELIIEKNRNGRTGIMKMLFFPARMEFTAAAPVDPREGPPTRD